MSTFVSLQPCLSLSLHLPTSIPSAAHLSLLLSTSLYLLPCLKSHSFLHPCLHTLSLLCLHSPQSPSSNSLYSAHPPPPPSPSLHPAQIFHISPSYLPVSCLVSLFFFPFSFSAWGSSSDVITPTVTMVSGERDCINCLDKNGQAWCCCITDKKKYY